MNSPLHGFLIDMLLTEYVYADNFKIIERVYIVALLVFRVSVLSILSMLEQVCSQILRSNEIKL